MRGLALLVGIIAGLAGFVFAYFSFVFAMFFNLNINSRFIALILLGLLCATPFVGTIGGIISYWKPLAGRVLMVVSGSGWIVIALLVVYLRWQDHTKPPLSAGVALTMAGFVSIPALASFLASWLAFRAARKARTADIP
jgi:hypothetical protein